MRNSKRGLLFFNPPYHRLGKEHGIYDSIGKIPIVPLGTASVFEYVKAYSGLPCDFYYSPDYSIYKIKEVINTFRPYLVCISCDSYNRFACLMIACIAKEIDSSIRVVFGGTHASFLDEQILLNYPFVDYVIRGEGESTLLDLINELKKSGDVSRVAGLSFRDGERFVRNDSRSRISNLDDVPLIDYEYFKSCDMENSSYKNYASRSFPVETSRGCVYSCNFCVTGGMFGRGITYRSIEKVIEQIRRMPKTGEETILFYDMNFTYNEEYIRKLCLALIRNNINIPWHCFTRVDLVDKSLFQLMKDAGCFAVFFGVESLSETILKGMNKGYTPEDAIKNLKIVAETGIQPRLSFIIGFPGETKKTLKESMMNCMKLPPTIRTRVAQLAVFPGSAIYAQAIREGFDETYWLKEHSDKIPLYEGALPRRVLERWEKIFHLKPWRNAHVDAIAGKDGMDDSLRSYYKDEDNSQES